MGVASNEISIPNFIQVYLPSYNISKLDAKSPSVTREVVTQVLNQGDDKALRWVFENYTLDKIRECVEKPQKGEWFPESLNYWRQILKVKKILNYDSAILNMYPQ